MTRSETHPRRLGRWGLFAIFLLTGLVNLLRSVLVLRFVPVLEGYELAIPPAVRAGFWSVWAVLLIGVAVVCLRRTHCHARPVAVLYQVTLWVVRLVGDQTTTAEGVGVQEGMWSLLFVVLVWFLTSRRSQSP